MTRVSGKRLAAFTYGEILADFSEREESGLTPEESKDFSKGKVRQDFSPITVKILRAHGGCLGTKSR